MSDSGPVTARDSCSGPYSWQVFLEYLFCAWVKTHRETWLSFFWKDKFTETVEAVLHLGYSNIDTSFIWFWEGVRVSLILVFFVLFFSEFAGGFVPCFQFYVNWRNLEEFKKISSNLLEKKLGFVFNTCLSSFKNAITAVLKSLNMER